MKEVEERQPVGDANHHDRDGHGRNDHDGDHDHDHDDGCKAHDYCSDDGKPGVLGRFVRFIGEKLLWAN